MDNMHYYSAYYQNKAKEKFLATVPEGAFLKAKEQEERLERNTTLLSLGTIVLGIILLVSFVY